MCESDWSNLPSVVLLHLYQYLARHDCISASSTCKNWREAFWFYPSWRKLHLMTARCHTEKNEFFVEKYSQRCRALSLSFVVDHFDEVGPILNNWAQHPRLSEFQMVGSGVCTTNSSCFELLVYPFLEKCNSLLKLILSHVENPFRLASLLARNSRTLKCLAIGTSSVPLINNKEEVLLVIQSLTSLNNVTILQLEGSWITNETLSAIEDLPLLRFIMTIQNSSKLTTTSVESWNSFHRKTNCGAEKRCEIRLTCYRMDNTDLTTNAKELISRASLTTTTHVRFLYCTQGFQEECVNRLMREHSFVHTIETIWAIQDPIHKNVFQPQPYVLCAWRFQHLKDIILSGSSFDKYDLEGMVRLRPALRIHIAKEDICKLNSEQRLLTQSELNRLAKALGGKGNTWSPMDQKRFNDTTLPSKDREALVLHQVYLDDFAD